MAAAGDGERRFRIRSLIREVLPEPVWFGAQSLRLRARHLPMHISPQGRRARAQLAALRDAHRGDTCVILGNGPSLRDFDVSRLDGLHTISTNRGYMLWQGTGRSPSFYVAVNPLVVSQFRDEIASQSCLIFVPWIMREQFAGVPNAVFVELRIEQRFLLDALQGLAPGGTVTVAALQLAYHMGFERTIMLGVDHRYETTGRPHEPVRQQGEDPNHFRSDYFADGVVWNAPDLPQSERSYRRARAAFDAAGRRIVNATPHSALEVFVRSGLDREISREAASQGGEGGGGPRAFT